MGSYCPPQYSRSLSGHQSLWESPEDSSGGRHLGPILTVLATSQGALDSPTHTFLQLPTSESKWSEVGAENGQGHYTRTEEDGRSRRPLPRALPGISTVLVPGLSMGASRWMGSFVLRQWGWICLSEQVSRRASARQYKAWMRAEHYLSQVNILNAFCPWWEETDLFFSAGFREGCSACPHPAMTVTSLFAQRQAGRTYGPW